MNQDVWMRDDTAVLENANEISTNSVKLDSVVYSIEYILSELSAFWSTNEDEHAFSTGLENSVDALSRIVECNNEFALSINEYISVLKKKGGNVL